MAVPLTHAPASLRSTVVSWSDRALASPIILALEIALLLAMTLTVITRLWSDHLWFGFLLLGVATVAWLPALVRPTERRAWFVYVAGIFLYTILRSFADETAIPVRTEYVIDIDRWLFLGTDPVPRLQDRLFERGDTSPLDYAAVFVHWSYFIVPHAAALWLFWRHRPLFPRFVALMVGIVYAGLLLFYLVPTTPPWLASELGALGSVTRIMDVVGGEANADSYESLSSALGEPNSVAAVPSIHMAVTFALFLWAWDHARRAVPWLLVYSAVMAFALVYLGEHYVLDAIVGVAVAVVCHLLARTLFRGPADAESAPRLAQQAPPEQ